MITRKGENDIGTRNGAKKIVVVVKSDKVCDVEPDGPVAQRRGGEQRGARGGEGEQRAEQRPGGAPGQRAPVQPGGKSREGVPSFLVQGRASFIQVI